MGVYSKLGGVWKGEKIVPETRNPEHGASPESWLQGEWIMYCAQDSPSGIPEVAKTFNPIDFDAESWVKLQRKRG